MCTMRKNIKFLLEYFCFWNVGSFRYKKTRTILYSSRLNYLRTKCVYVKKKEKLIKKLKKKTFQREMNGVGGCLPASLECHGFRMRPFAWFGIRRKTCSECPCPGHLKQINVFLTYFLKTFFLGINIGPEGSDILIFYKKKGIVLGVNIGPNSNVLKIKPWHLKHF